MNLRKPMAHPEKTCGRCRRRQFHGEYINDTGGKTRVWYCAPCAEKEKEERQSK